MHDYSELRRSHAKIVSQTIDSPILIFDYFELSDAFAALGVILVFGVLFYSWDVMALLLVLTLGLGPYVRRRNLKGIFFHYPYRKFGISLPGLINPGRSQKFSD